MFRGINVLNDLYSPRPPAAGLGGIGIAQNSAQAGVLWQAKALTEAVVLASAILQSDLRETFAPQRGG